MCKLCPTHNHSQYSQIDGLSTCKEIVDRAVEMGCEAIGLTDHGVVAGHLDFAKECDKAGIKPLFGCELYHGTRIGEKLGNKRDQAHLIALAMTDEGLRNLWRINDAAAQEDYFHHVGRTNWENLEKYKKDIVFTSACPLGLVAKGIIKDDFSALNRYLDIFGDDFLIELTTYPGDAEFNDKDSDEPIRCADLNHALLDIAQERGLRVIYGDNGHYARKDQWAAHDAYVAKSTGDSIYTPPSERKMFHPEGALCIKTEEEVRKALSYLGESVVDEALETSVWLGRRADATLPEVRRHLPVFIPNDCPWVEENKYEDDEADKLFIDLVEQGMYTRYGDSPSERVVDQTIKEAEIFVNAGLHHYFLLGWDVFQFCKNAPGRPIEVGPGRGSSAGCIVAFELGITDVDPLPYDLIFERFWNPGRAKGFPDIDSDFEQGRRKEVKEYLTRRWGHDRVRSIGTVSRMTPKALVDMLGRPCGLHDEEMSELKKIIENTPDLEILGADQIGWDSKNDPGKPIYVTEPTEDYDHDTGKQILDWVDDQPQSRHEILDRFLDFCSILCNRVSNYGVHASGIVISDVDLPDIAPCRFAGSPTQRIPVTQFAMNDIEDLMLIKLDALGLRTLDVLADWKAQMKETHGIEIDWSQLEWEDHPKELWEMLWTMTAGVFQVEEGFASKLCKELHPSSVEALSKIGATNRPGPIRSGAPESFIRIHQGLEEKKFDHPFLEDVTDVTDGWFLYQEQVIRFFSKMGYSESDADAVRKILGKKQPEKWDAIYYGKDEWEGKSYQMMTEKNGIDKKSADVIWRKLKDFGKYSFNKSHSVAYGTIGFRCAYAKYWGTSEFYIACIRNVDKQKKAKRIPRYINEARRWGIKVYGPDIERSKVQVSTYENDLYFGFNDIHKVSEQGGALICELREHGEVDLTSPEALSEFLEEQGKIRTKENTRRKKAMEPKLEGKSLKQQLTSEQIRNLYTAGAWERVEDYPTPMREMQEREKEMIGVILSDNAADAFSANADIIDECDLYDEVLEPYSGEDMKFRVPGVITSVRPTTVKKGPNKGQSMGIVTIEYDGKEIDFAVFHDKWVSSKFLWNERTPALFVINHSLNKKNNKPGYNFESGQILKG
jgi:DNA polymerase-3 subunit alpha